MNGQETQGRLEMVTEQIATLAAEFGFEDEDALNVEDKWVDLEVAIDDLRTGLNVAFEKVFERRARLNPAPKLRPETVKLSHVRFPDEVLP